ncbi:hypothetical protein USDA257_c19080 [Sinorhizobium fredii USDA 257]|uniref:Uncharacterized protein n=1 Tax=Sinorhizobium fredii (strain USDA 257) TaxID=1185652 RepID=I3X3N9_SINF2|nr:hypothetical protein USDA257_c19080 [Sinorhizobium fredii USDA 257]
MSESNAEAAGEDTSDPSHTGLCIPLPMLAARISYNFAAGTLPIGSGSPI